MLVERGSHLIAANLGARPAVITAPGVNEARRLAVSAEVTNDGNPLRLGPESSAALRRR